MLKETAIFRKCKSKVRKKRIRKRYEILYCEIDAFYFFGISR